LRIKRITLMAIIKPKSTLNIIKGAMLAG
jgi:hypothetical protein